MSRLIDDILLNAKSYFRGFGFDDGDIEYLLQKGRRDLEMLVQEVNSILESNPVDMELLDKKLHALKGVIMQLGSSDIAMKINQMRDALNNQDTIDNLKEIIKS